MASIFGLRRLPSDIGRLSHISRTFLAIGLGLLYRQIQARIIIPAVHRFAPERARRMHVPEIDLPSRIRQAFEELGPTFIKFGQILSTRPDIIPGRYVAEFEKLQSKVPPFSYQEVKRIVAGELGRPLESIFASFEPLPLAAASIAQVHYATLPSGARLAVKVQRPGVKRSIEEDIRLLRWLARFAERHVPGVRYYRPVELVEEFGDWTTRELDFRVEGRNADHFRYDFRGDPTVYVPGIHWDLTTAKILTMEFVDGATIDDSDKMTLFGIDREELAIRGARSLLKQVFLHGFFHGDPHPGNFFALPGNVICYHDFGIVGYLSDDLRRELTSFFIAFVRGDPQWAVEHLLHLATPMESASPERFRRDLTDLTGAWHYTGRLSLARTFLGILQAAATHRMAFPSALALLGKALITVESVGFNLYPGFDIDKEFRPFIAEVFKSWLSPTRVIKAMESGILDYAHALEEAPKRFSEVMDTVARGQVSVKIERSELDSLREELHHTSVMRVLAPLVIVLILASAIAFRAEGIAEVGGVSIGLIWFIGAVALGIWLLVLLLRR